MAGSGQDWEESVGFQRQDQFLNLKRKRDRDISVHTTHTSRIQSRGRSYISQEENTKSIVLEIDHLCRRLRRERRRRTPSYFDPSSDDDGDGSYRPRSKTPPSESFSYDEDRRYYNIIAHPWCDGHSTSISICGVWGVRGKVQVFRRKRLYTYTTKLS